MYNEYHDYPLLATAVFCMMYKTATL